MRNDALTELNFRRALAALKRAARASTTDVQVSSRPQDDDDMDQTPDHSGRSDSCS